MGSTVEPWGPLIAHPCGAATNQVPPLVGHNVVAADLALSEAVVRHGSAEVLEGLLPLGAEAGTAEAREQGRLANEHHPELTTYDRYGNRIDEVEFHPAWHWLMERAVGHGLAAAAVGAAGRRRPRRAPAPRGRVHGLVAHRARPRLPDLDDLRRDPGAARRRRAGQGVDAAAGLHDVRPRAAAGRGEARRAVRHGDDREAGRLRRPRQRHRGAADRPTASYTLHGHKWFTSAPMNDVFLVLAQARRRRDLLRGAAGAARRHPQPARRRPAQGQARQPVQRLLRARVRRHRRAPARRRGPRRAHDHRDGRRDPARLRARLGRADAARGLRGVVARRAPLGVRRRCSPTSR